MEFLELIYGEAEGFSYSPTKEAGGKAWSQYFFKWPQDKDGLIRHIVTHSRTHDVYYSPMLFKEADATKEAFETCQVVWAEFDGITPSELGSVPRPSVKIQSSTSGHEHWYWLLESELRESSAVEAITRRIAYALGADFCFNSNRVLRPAGTLHHDSGLPVRIISQAGNVKYSVTDFAAIAELPISLLDFSLGTIPRAVDVVAKYPWSKEDWNMFQKDEQKEGSRSSALTRLGHTCFEMGMTNGETYAILSNADLRWGKFAGRSDRKERLIGLVKYCKSQLIKENKLTKEGKPAEKGLPIFSFKEFVRSERAKVEWVIPELFPKKGSAIIGAQPGIGKTQFSLRLAMSLATGKPFVGWKITEPQKTSFFSFEMGPEGLSYFTDLMASKLSSEELELMHENLFIVPLGYSLDLTSSDEAKKDVLKVINKTKSEGIILDSLGSSTGGDLSSDAVVNRLFSFLKEEVQQKRNSFVWGIHHNRKGQVGNKKPKSLDDFYGNRYFAAHIDLGLFLWKTGEDIELSYPKTRYGKERMPQFIRRTDDLNFELSRLNTSQIKPRVKSNNKEDSDGDFFQF